MGHTMYVQPSAIRWTYGKFQRIVVQRSSEQFVQPDTTICMCSRRPFDGLKSAQLQLVDSVASKHKWLATVERVRNKVELPGCSSLTALLVEMFATARKEARAIEMTEICCSHRLT